MRDRYKIFIIDEVHRLSKQRVRRAAEVDRRAAAVRRVHDGDDRAARRCRRRSSRGRRSSSSRSLPSSRFAISCRRSPRAKALPIDDGALTLLARSADGSMRDAQSAFDQVIAFAEQERHRRRCERPSSGSSAATCRSTSPRPSRARTAPRRSRSRPVPSSPATTCAMSSASCRGCLRDLLLIGLDSSRLEDPEIAAESERDRLRALAALFSSEDLMRAFDVLTKAELRHPRFDAAPLPSRAGAAALDSPAPARAARRHHQRTGKGRRYSSASHAPGACTPRRRCAAASSRSEAGRVECLDRASRRGQACRRDRREGGTGTGTCRRSRCSRCYRARRTCGCRGAARGGRRCRAQGSAARRAQEDEEVLLRHRDRAGAEDRNRRRPSRPCFRAGHRVRSACSSNRAARGWKKS